MSRLAVYFEFEGELFDLFSIKTIRRFESYNTDTLQMDYGLIINEEIHEDASFRDIKFRYKTPEVRDSKLEKIKNAMLQFEYVIIIS